MSAEQVARMRAIQAEWQSGEDSEPAGEPAITMSVDAGQITFRDQAALDEYVMGVLDAVPCPQGIHGWRQQTPNGLCPWCEWERHCSPGAPS